MPIFLVTYGCALLLPAGLAPLVETTEARYSEIAREMLASGNFLEPCFNGIKHFHKPPLAYWAIAAGLRLFGTNDFGARFFGAVAALVAVFFLYRLAGVVLESKRQAFHAAVVFATSLLMMAVSRIVSTDIYLTACTMAAQYYLFRQAYGRRSPKNAVCYGVCLGLGFMAKGPVILLFTLLPFLVAKLFDTQHRRVFTVVESVLAILSLMAVALPWYLLVIGRNPGLLDYLLTTQTIDRVATNRFERYQPPWYFLCILAATFLPYLLFLLKGARSIKVLGRPTRVLLVYVCVPLLFFSLNQSKQATYILPLYGAASLFSAAAYNRFPMPRLRIITLGLIGPLALALTVAPFFVETLPGVWRGGLAAAGLGALFLAWQALKARAEENFLIWVGSVLLLFGTVGYAVYGNIAHHTRGYELLTEHLNVEDPGRSLPVLVYKQFLPSVSFYRDKLAVMAMGGDRETQFESNSGFKGFYLENDQEIEAFLGTVSELFLVTKPEHLESFASRYGAACEQAFVHRKITAYRCVTKRDLDEKDNYPPQD